MAKTTEQKNAATRDWFARHPGYAAEKSAKFRRENPEYSSKWATANPDKRRAYTSSWLEENRDLVNVTRRERHAKNPQPRRNREKLRREQNGEAYRQQDRAKYAADPIPKRKRARIWKKQNPGAVRDHNRSRTAAKRANGGRFTPQEWRELKHRFGNRCLACGLGEPEIIALGRTLVPDHVIPVAKGGTSDIGNIQPLCHGKGGCNLKKAARHIDYRSAA